MKKMFKVKLKAFTLAEVLITLGIIGVVAALTVPTLINNINISSKKTELKKVVSTVRNAATSALAHYDMDFSSYLQDAACAITDKPEINYSFCSIFNATLSGHTMSDTPPVVSRKASSVVYYSPVNITGAPTEALRYLTLSDGAMIVFSGKAKGCTKNISTGVISGSNCTGYIDLNGAKGPNKEVSCKEKTTTKTEYAQPDCYFPGHQSDDIAFNIFVPAANAAVCEVSGSICRCPAGYSEVYGKCGLEKCTRTATVTTTDPCEVPKDSNHVTDIVPVTFHDGIMELSTDAGKYIFDKL